MNTCAVRDNAEQRVIGRMGELQRHKRPGTVLGVVGCMAQRLGPILLERVPKVDLVVGPDGYRNLPELLGHAAGGMRTADVEYRSWEHYEDIPQVRAAGPTAFVTVQRGCDYRCTFCIVPTTRDPSAHAAWLMSWRRCGRWQRGHQRGDAAGPDREFV